MANCLSPWSIACPPEHIFKLSGLDFSCYGRHLPSPRIYVLIFIQVLISRRKMNKISLNKSLSGKVEDFEKSDKSAINTLRIGKES